MVLPFVHDISADCFEPSAGIVIVFTKVPLTYMLTEAAPTMQLLYSIRAGAQIFHTEVIYYITAFIA